ncbi:uncharacterized protein LOC136039808 isoform X1 [Artemia franciscana]|uniref:uncharacterized protein LOC136039808 isoform X1 n=1 Tax=Artemia franciscana TaxID=6661 RepID=UPI0032DAAAA8
MNLIANLKLLLEKESSLSRTAIFPIKNPKRLANNTVLNLEHVIGIQTRIRNYADMIHDSNTCQINMDSQEELQNVLQKLDFVVKTFEERQGLVFTETTPEYLKEINALEFMVSIGFKWHTLSTLMAPETTLETIQ